ncbi:MAG: DUF488 domain-containing protein [Frateuria sp.]|uniref:DUF488 domain-containing protein n=1 Tax=Frateuria sp. TaxID=2211372 RepID=UPI0017BECF23|nr:DUF488 domain-containing protein [Frateuria sp.]NUO71424.1 DUF488 domain-containing protein [Frateuria sp.]NUR24021.1 DUF488 domain-containing protein [Frateuria sp.]
MSLAVKRVYEPPSPKDGCRVLVDRLWPRGLKKEDAALDLWVKEVGPSRELRQWFGHEPTRWEGFRHRYAGELDATPDAWHALAEKARRGRVTLLFGARDEEHNNAVALKAYLESYLAAHGPH